MSYTGNPTTAGSSARSYKVSRGTRSALLPAIVGLLMVTVFLGATVPASGAGGSETAPETDGPAPGEELQERNIMVHSGQVPLEINYTTADEAAELGYEAATLAGGCFWCMEPPYEDLEGIIDVTSGFSGGDLEHPRYRQVTAGGTGHIEVIQLIYDPEIISYSEILDIYWVNIDPLDDGGQFCDRGDIYRSAIFYHDDEQRRIAEEYKRELDESGRFHEPIVTEIRAYEEFYPAEQYHQGYARRNPVRYSFYRSRCGRDPRLAELWRDFER